ncbi:hypothetical protein EDD27_2527 [Nonomuraea polychroma]|uniref:Uncharacterized protein n=1 Tax=Nonomuraea polychroma TaxID=46176 RepID=A0A438M3W2_9ACTN|nr:hypothetical protein EDD27_2527 [Nonomuraea polychroma]
MEPASDDVESASPGAAAGTTLLLFATYSLIMLAF